MHRISDFEENNFLSSIPTGNYQKYIPLELSDVTCHVILLGFN